MGEGRGRRSLITLLTDFGTSDTYVGQMKGVIAGINPDAQVMDITHAVRPQQIKQGAFLAQTAWHAFPAGTVHVAVVDPGVGTERRGIVIVTGQRTFVGPDNGVLSAALPDQTRPAAADTIPVPQGVRAYEITNPSFMREEVSATFHGRDVFSPTAAYFSLGRRPDEVGPAIETLTALPAFRARDNGDGTFLGEVVHVDYYGNAITDIWAEDLPAGRFTLEVVGRAITGPFRTFADLTEAGAVVGGSGYLGIAAPQGNAAQLLGVAIGTPVRLRPGGKIP